MKSQELRIGNLVFGQYPNNKEVIEVEKISNFFVNGLGISAIEPIPLTEELLFKFGFEKAENGFWCPNETLSYRDGYFGFGTDRHTKLDFVHQLQNLYFALTNKQL